MHLSVLLISLGALALLAQGEVSEGTKDALRTVNETKAEERERLLAQITRVHIDKSEEDVHFEDAFGKPSGLKTRQKRQASTFSNKWTNNTVYYFFDKNLQQETRNGVQIALKGIQDRSCIKFVESRTAPNRIRLYQGQKCESDIGMTGGQQDMSLGAGCGRVVGNIQHEFFHALGFMHTQSREGRDDYINVDMTGLTEYVDQANVMSTEVYVPYEYGSMMHYPADLYSGRKIAFVPKDPRYLYTMGSKMMSFNDIKALNKHYGCTGCAVCKNGGVPNVRDCRVCECPAGYGGTLCDERPSGCGNTLTAESTWKTEKITVGETNQNNIRDNFQKCNTWITAPKGKEIEVKITEIINSNCNFGCNLNGIEIKGDEDIRVTNPRYCCPESTGTVIRSVQNPTPIITYARSWYATFTIEYRYVSACMDNGYCYDGYCDSEDKTFADKKFNCGKTCGLCGQPLPVCADNDMCAQFLGDSSCQNVLENDFAGNDQMLEYYCAKSCGYCAENATTTTTTTTTSTTTTLKPAADEPKVQIHNGTKNDCEEKQNACEKAFGDVVPGKEWNYSCGNYCKECLASDDSFCVDSKFCDGLIKEHGDCTKLVDVFNNDNDLIDLFCGKTCAFWCKDI